MKNAILVFVYTIFAVTLMSSELSAQLTGQACSSSEVTVDVCDDFQETCEDFSDNYLGFVSELPSGDPEVGTCFYNVDVLWSEPLLQNETEEKETDSENKNPFFGFHNKQDELFCSECAVCKDEEDEVVIKCWPVVTINIDEDTKNKEARFYASLMGGKFHQSEDKSKLNYNWSIQPNLALNLAFNFGSNLVIGFNTDFQADINENIGDDTSPDFFTFHDLGVYLSHELSKQVSGGYNYFGYMLRLGWTRQKLIYDSNYLDNTAYSFYGGIRSYIPWDTDRRVDSFFPGARVITNLDNQTRLSLTLEANYMYSFSINAAHVPTLVVDARLDFLGKYAYPQSSYIEDALFLSPKEEQYWILSMQGIGAISPKINMGIQTKTETISAVLGYAGEYSVDSTSIELTEGYFEQDYRIHNLFLSFRFDILSIYASVTNRINELHSMDEPDRDSDFKDWIFDIKGVFRPFEILTLYRKVLPRWRHALNLYVEYLDIFKTGGSGPVVRAPNSFNDDIFIIGVSSILPVYPLNATKWYGSSWVIEGLVDLQLVNNQQYTSFALLLGLRFRPEHE